MGKALRIIGRGVLWAAVGMVLGGACGIVSATVAFVPFWGAQDFWEGIKVGAIFGFVVGGVVGGALGMLLYEDE